MTTISDANGERFTGPIVPENGTGQTTRRGPKDGSHIRSSRHHALLLNVFFSICIGQAPWVNGQLPLGKEPEVPYGNVNRALEALTQDRYSRVVRNERNELTDVRIPYEFQTDRMLMILPKMPSLEKLEIGFGNYTETGFSQLKQCHALTNLVLKCFVEFPPYMMRVVSELKNLRVLEIYVQKIKTDELTMLAEMSLETLSIQATTNFHRGELARLSQMRELKHIVIRNTGVTSRDRDVFEKFTGLLDGQIHETLDNSMITWTKKPQAPSR